MAARTDGTLAPRTSKGMSIKRNTDARLSSTRTNTREMSRRKGANNTTTNNSGQITTGQNGSNPIISRGMGRSTCARRRGTNTSNTADSEVFGRTTARGIGRVNIVAGADGVVTGATGFLMIASVRILAVATGSASATPQELSWTDTLDSSTGASGSVSLIRGRNTGRALGTKPT